MALRRFQSVNTQDRVLQRIQANVSDVLDPLAKSPTADALLLEGVELKSGKTNHVPHKLGRKLVGWHPARVRAQATLWDSQDSNASPERTIDLHTSADVTADLVVF
jgi:hypothetical protein